MLIATYSIVLSPVVLVFDRTPENLTQFAAVSTCIAALFVGLRFRSDLQRSFAKLGWSASRKLLLAGGLGAAFTETEYEVWQHVFGASGVAANPNLAVDLLETMPWYLLMLGFLAVALKHRRVSLFQLLLLGGIYEFMADGLLGSILGGKPLFDFLGLPFAIPIFTLVYSPIVALPAVAIWPSYQEEWSATRPSGSRLWLFFPCLAIILYGAPLAMLLLHG